MSRLIVLLLFFITITTSAFASWTGPVEIISGSWGKGEGQFGLLHEDTSDSFPSIKSILPSGEIIIDDYVNERVLVYDHEYKKIKQSYWVLTRDSSGEEYYQLPEYGISTVKRFMPDGRYWTSDGNQYDSQNNPLATNDDKPLELGVKRKGRWFPGNQYLQIIEFEDVNFAIVTTNGIGGIVRDSAGFLYGTESVPGIKTERRKRVHKFDRCSREIAHVDLPEDDIRYQDFGIGDGPTTYVTVIEEYGPPVIGPDGSVYAWKRTPETYSILKWIWVNEPSFTNVDFTKKFESCFLTDLDKLSLRILRNTIFAKHGRMFKSNDLKEYFASKDWYKARPNYQDDMLSDIDKANVELIMKYEAEK